MVERRIQASQVVRPHDKSRGLQALHTGRGEVTAAEPKKASELSSVPTAQEGKANLGGGGLPDLCGSRAAHFEGDKKTIMAVNWPVPPGTVNLAELGHQLERDARREAQMIAAAERLAISQPASPDAVVKWESYLLVGRPAERKPIAGETNVQTKEIKRA